ncbi:class I SAM-dependent methyltransferase [Novosphingobium sp. BW1]|uniref:class I SAM-dependent methyltransferase n=1 Tax=Novosphingobium sp. BW1 TaxID=2592621 RepID=UPI0011DEEDA5|nr:class I SAM-dependent methyltransferase [Novosphingobium sp. BW1]TYC86154.1 class I SAM-dependent methyltransferase [Novosphingobium sp. BW1]
MRRSMLALSTCLGLLAAPVVADAPEDGAEVVSCNGCEALLELAAATPARKDDRARDVYRHPVETLKFMGVAPDMKVGEYAPGGGWYSRMLAPYLAEEGHLTGLYFNPDVVPFDGSKLAESAAAFPGKVVEWTGVDPDSVSGMTLKDIPDAEKGSYDRIVLFRMLHNMMNWNIADAEVKAMRTLLKDDGLLGVVQHRAKADAPFSYTNGSKGYLRQADVVRLMELNGFELVASSEINANPKDPANWEGGVWTLPPQFALKEQDKAKYAAIGESDRMTLLFRKRD